MIYHDEIKEEYWKTLVAYIIAIIFALRPYTFLYNRNISFVISKYKKKLYR